MKIVLISLYYDFWIVGVRSLAACLRRAGYKVQIVFLLSLPTYEYAGKLIGKLDDVILNSLTGLCFDADLVGVSLTTSDFYNAKLITSKIKQKLTVPVIWGGIHPTIRPYECLEFADMVCIGEGEQVIVEVADSIKYNKRIDGINGIGFNQNGKIVINDSRPLINDLDSLPFPDYSDVDDFVLNSDGKFYMVDKELLRKYIVESGRESAGAYIAMPSRGCPFGCTYCANNTLNKMYSGQKILRRRSIENIIEELKSAKLKMPYIKSVRLLDDAFFLFPEEEIINFTLEYKKHINLPLFVFGLTPTTITREKLETLIDAGMTKLRMGIQSASERILKLYKRNYTKDQIMRAVKLINEFKEKMSLPYYDIIIDNPWESEEDLVETLMFLSSLPVPFAFTIYSLTMYPETELYLRAKSEGIINDDISDVYNKNYQVAHNLYLNRFFYLLHDYAVKGRRIPPATMAFLTNRKFRKLKISLLLYWILKFSINPRKQILLFKNLFYKAVEDLVRGDFSRIIKYLK